MSEGQNPESGVDTVLVTSLRLLMLLLLLLLLWLSWSC